MSLGSKYGEVKEFYKLLMEFKNHKSLTTETKDRNDRIMKNTKTKKKESATISSLK